MGKLVLGLVIACALISSVVGGFLVKVHCAGQPVFRGRLDPIVSPGAISNHVHRVSGSSGFAAYKTTDSPATVFNGIKNSKCSTCSLPVVDQSSYWHPDLYYQWPNGSLSLVPKGGLTVYYEGRTGSTGDQKNQKLTAFPAGFRMVAGNPFRRNFNASRLQDQAISFVCLVKSGPNAPQTNAFPDPKYYCANGLRLQVYFPMCWNGVDLDSPDHSSHVAYPKGVDGGDCPAGFPKRLPGVFFEAFYSITDFPQQSYQPYVLACGDSTGYGFHGDFLNGWDPVILQRALDDASCDNTKTNNGNDVAACAPLAPFLKDTSSGACPIDAPVPLTEDLGLVYAIPKLPGCAPITGAQATNPKPCSATPQQSYTPGVSERFFLVAKQTGKYFSLPSKKDLPILATVTANPSLTEVFAFVPWKAASGAVTGVAWATEAGDGVTYCSASATNSAVQCNRGSPSTSDGSYEAFQLVQNGSYIAIKAVKNGKYLTLQSDGSLAPTSTTVGDAQLFSQLVPNGGGLANTGSGV